MRVVQRERETWLVRDQKNAERMSNNIFVGEIIARVEICVTLDRLWCTLSNSLGIISTIRN